MLEMTYIIDLLYQQEAAKAAKEAEMMKFCESIVFKFNVSSGVNYYHNNTFFYKWREYCNRSHLGAVDHCEALDAMYYRDAGLYALNNTVIDFKNPELEGLLDDKVRGEVFNLRGSGERLPDYLAISRYDFNKFMTIEEAVAVSITVTSYLVFFILRIFIKDNYLLFKLFTRFLLFVERMLLGCLGAMVGISLFWFCGYLGTCYDCYHYYGNWTTFCNFYIG